MNLVSIAIAFCAIAVGSLVKGITGLGLPVVAVPVLSYFLNLPHAVGVLIIPILVTNALQAYQTRHAVRNVPFLWPMLLLGVPGLAGGTWVLTVVAAEKLNLGLGLMLFFYIGLRVFSPQFSIKPKPALRLSPFVGLAAGFVQGAAGLCAAVFVPFVHAMKLEREAMLFTVSMVFLVFAMVQAVSLTVAGLFQPVYFVEGLLALIPVALFMPLGSWLGKRLSRQVFDRVFLVVLALIGAGLIETALR
ncbi:sulfite exporter TauE/SafE family protein [Nitratireductor indicus]|uniref:Probable membrane transporter protein n=1 Tax=Nitratireductor indicus C115 TaxID=1231190 RepID=K2P0B0_9HYPH|nr:sulfite exporter TauE/SafE family protein [Nitratireductor indicus]EKF40756.1 glutamine amidotransferase [Nitratireductor indicus C115]MDS1136413.1 sulfite exporter TauE/SafE family protein [Nitratireductor indicus]SFQ75728.1 hypothetical protein SAMN05216176_11387 [Nitratireductor indicus]